jgi:hypothetical protein
MLARRNAGRRICDCGGGRDSGTRVWGHHVARPPQAQSGLGVVPDDEYTFQGSHPHAYASQDRVHHIHTSSLHFTGGVGEEGRRSGQR